MAQVTMSGSEYAAMLKKEEQLGEVMNYLCLRLQVRFPAKEEGSFSAWEFPETPAMPKWAQDWVVDYMAGWLRSLPEEEFFRWVDSGARYLDVRDLTLSKYCFNPQHVDLWEYPRLRDIVALAQGRNPQEEEEEV